MKIKNDLIITNAQHRPDLICLKFKDGRTKNILDKFNRGLKEIVYTTLCAVYVIVENKNIKRITASYPIEDIDWKETIRLSLPSRIKK